ncbi:MAG: signal recognition particle-docking protein FtsY [Acidimicrobiales bacterium]
MTVVFVVAIVLFAAVLLSVPLLARGRLRRRAPETRRPEPPPATIEAPPPAVGEAVPVDAAPPVLAPLVKPRFRDRLGKARALFSGFLSRTDLDQATWDDLEEALIRADVGVGYSTRLLDDLRARVKEEGIVTPGELVEVLRGDLKKALASADRGLRFEPGETNVWLFVGVNGVGKTTTIGKLAYREILAGRRVIMAAGDTFRAAAAEQLELWSTRVGADLVRGAEGGDPGAVIFDAVQRASARGAELVLGDTAGRLHTKVNLMEELKKVRRVAERPPGHVTEVLLVIDATTGQNGLVQAKEFADAVDVTGVVLTKLDGTAKGGIALAIQAELGIPIKLVGLGEAADDLVEFDPDEFVDALLAP